MENELKGTTRPLPEPAVRKEQALRALPVQKGLMEIDVALISPAGFHHNLYKADNELFTTSLYEIDRLLEDKRAEERDTEERDNEELVDALLPSQHHPFRDVFSKQAADEMPPHRTYDHKIVLENDAVLGHSPLYNHSAKELEALKAYLVDNLAKGFIESSQAPFGAPILFVKKPNGSLRLCVDYRKLNALTRKDRYPLPLINETLARMAAAKVYTKLDIQQAFNRI
jgi:hypothetical protein